MFLKLVRIASRNFKTQVRSICQPMYSFIKTEDRVEFMANLQNFKRRKE